MFYTYILEELNTGKRYIGYTGDLRKRMLEHNQSKTRSTRGRVWKCIYYEACVEQEDAHRRESYFKTSEGKNALRKRLFVYNKKSRRRDGETSLHG